MKPSSLFIDSVMISIRQLNLNSLNFHDYISFFRCRNEITGQTRHCTDIVPTEKME